MNYKKLNEKTKENRYEREIKMQMKELETAELFNYINDMFSEIGRRKEECAEKQQYFDKRISNIYHKIETEKINQENSRELMEELQYFLRLRRIVKRDRYIFESVSDFNGSDKVMDYNKAARFISELSKLQCFSNGVLNSNAAWSNVDELGDLNYGQVDEEYNKKFGDINDKLKQLQEYASAR